MFPVVICAEAGAIAMPMNSSTAVAYVDAIRMVFINRTSPCEVTGPEL
jgi:hypothetical protein